MKIYIYIDVLKNSKYINNETDQIYVKNTIKYQIFGDAPIGDTLKFDTSHIEIIAKAFAKAENLLSNLGFIFEPVRVFIIPTINSFITDNMSGISGYTYCKGCFFVYINIDSLIKSQDIILNVILHESIHMMSLSYFPWEHTVDGLIFEGLTEAILRDTFGYAPSKWSSSISQDESKNAMNIHGDDFLKNDIYNFDLFFNGYKELPPWAGYALGFMLVDFYKNQTNKDWKEIIKTEPLAIYNFYITMNKI